jgi:Flp pilus assembly protein TadD
MKQRRTEWILSLARAASLASLVLPACGGEAAVATRAPAAAPPLAAPPASVVADPRDVADTPGATASSIPTPAPAPAPGSTANVDSTASAPLPPPRPTTLRLGDGELAAGDEACEKGDLDAARKHYAAAPRGVASTVGLARVRIARVDVPLDYAAAKGNAEVAAAAADLLRATRAVPPFGPAFVELGRARLLLGDAPGAIGALQKGTQLLPDEPEAHSQLGVALLATGHAADAVRELARAEQLDPGSAARRGNLGTALMMAGRTREAIGEYETRARMDDGDARAHSDLGTALLATQDLERALSELERAVKLDPQRPSAHSNLGYALQQAGKMAPAVAEYREALRLDPKLVSAWINLATALARDPKTRREARADLERARLLSPGRSGESRTPRRALSSSVLDLAERHPLALRPATASSPFRQAKREVGKGPGSAGVAPRTDALAVEAFRWHWDA